MKNYIQIAYLVSSFIAILAMVPQLRQVMKVKHSKELNIHTWTSWAVCQSISLVYALSVNATEYAIVSVLWIIMYSSMVFLIARYKYNVPLIVLNVKTSVIHQVTSLGNIPIHSEQLKALKSRIDEIIKTVGNLS